MSKMTLDEAIIIAKESSEDQCIGARGREEYKQLAAWLEELKQYKNKECEISARENREPLYKITWKEFYILCAFKGEPGNKSISWYAALSDMKKRGFFKNVPADVAINEILRNCEVI